MSAKAGTPLAEIEALVAWGGQACFRADGLRAAARWPATCGSTVGAAPKNLAGPRRIRPAPPAITSPRVSAVSGRSEIFKSGGRVVKNVTGYDLSKMLAGSLWHACRLTDVTIKVLPKPETEETLVVLGLDDAAASRHGRGHGVGVRGLGRRAFAGATSRPLGQRPARRAHRVAARGRAGPSVAHRKAGAGGADEALRPRRTLGRDGFARALARRARRKALRGRRRWPTGRCGASRPRRPSAALELAAPHSPADAELFYDWAGGLVWLARRPDDAGAARCAAVSRGRGGHATLVRAPAAVRAAVEVFEPQDPAVRRVDEAGQGELRSQGRAQSGGCAGFGNGTDIDANLLHARPARRSADRGIGEDPARLRALRLLHRDLSDLCAARRRARFPARAHLPDQGHAGARPAGDRRGGQAYRPLPVLPRLHDHLSVRRALHAPRRSRPRTSRRPTAGRCSIRLLRVCWRG